MGKDKKKKGKKKEKIKEKKKGKKAIPALTAIPPAPQVFYQPLNEPVPGPAYSSILPQAALMDEVPQNVFRWNKNSLIAACSIIATLATIILMMIAVNQTSKSLSLTRETLVSHNTPALQIQDMRVSGDSIFYSIANLGQYPAKILEAKFAYAYINLDHPTVNKENPIKYVALVSEEIEEGDSIIKISSQGLTDSSITNTYLLKEYPVERWQKRNQISKLANNRDALKNKNCFFGQIIYRDEDRKVNRVYYFNALVPQTEGRSFEFLGNVNKDMPEK
jgi:hypothetical protein